MIVIVEFDKRVSITIYNNNNVSNIHATVIVNESVVGGCILSNILSL